MQLNFYGSDTRVIRSDGIVLPLFQVEHNDMLLVEDSTFVSVNFLQERNVKLYNVAGYDRRLLYRAQSSHLVELFNSKSNQVHQTSVASFSSVSATRQHSYHFISPDLKFPSVHTLIEPWLLGLWLADGSQSEPVFFVKEHELQKELSDIAEFYDCFVTRRSSINSFSFVSYFTRNKLQYLLGFYHLLHNKHVPPQFIFTSVERQMELVGGFLDGDGYYRHDRFEMKQGKRIHENLFYSVVLTARLAGLRCSVRYNSQFQYLNTTITGALDRLPIVCKAKIPSLDSDSNTRLSQCRVSTCGIYPAIRLEMKEPKRVVGFTNESLVLLD